MSLYPDMHTLALPLAIVLCRRILSSNTVGIEGYFEHNTLTSLICFRLYLACQLLNILIMGKNVSASDNCSRLILFFPPSKRNLV